MRLATPTTIELTYRLLQDVLKPTIDVQSKLVALIKREAMDRFSRGESLTFRVSVAGLFEIDVSPADATLSLPRQGGRVEFVVRRKGEQNTQALAKHFASVLRSETSYPNAASKARFARLVGLTQEKALALEMLSLIFSPEEAYAWGRKHHCETLVANLLAEPAYPVLIFEGRPGLGKTELARTIGDPLARALGLPVVSYRVSLTLRGSGLVGELSQNIAKLMEFAKLAHLERGANVLLLIDEADAIAQKRDGKQPQHHEEQVGVNTLLAEIDDLRASPGVGIIFTTNMHQALDDAVKKRTNAHWIHFRPPGTGERFYLLRRFLGERFSAPDLRRLAHATDGFAPRDIVELCRAAFYQAKSKDTPVTLPRLLQAASLLRASDTTGSQEEALPRKTDATLRLLELPKHGNGHKVPV